MALQTLRLGCNKPVNAVQTVLGLGGNNFSEGLVKF